MAKKQSTTSSKKVPKKRNIRLSDGTMVVADDNNKKFVARKNVFKKSADPEDEKTPDDKIGKHKYPPPKKEKVFRDKWSSFIDLVVERNSFKVAHLHALEILCDLYAELDALDRHYRTHGATYEVITATGKDIKTYPQTNRRDKVREQIAKYTRFLDLFPKKDTGLGGGSDGEEEEWS